MRRHDQKTLSRALRRRARSGAPRRCARGENIRAREFSDRRARHRARRCAVRARGHLSRFLLRPARAQNPGTAAQALANSRGPHDRRDAALGRVLRLRRHVRGEVRRDFQRDRRAQDGRHRRLRRAGPARRRSRLSPEHGGQTFARGPHDRGASRRRSARRDDGCAADRRNHSGRAAMTVHTTSPQFKQNAHEAIHDAPLQKALNNMRTGFIERRALAAAELPEFEALCDSARDIKKHTLQHLDLYLEAYEKKVIEAGGRGHFCRTPGEANAAVLSICKARGARTVTKGKSMISEEMGLNDVLLAEGINPIETDLGEYIIQLRGEIPSHIIAPAVHLNKEQVEADFRRVHTHLPRDRVLTKPTQLLTEARAVLRERFLAADVGITGANFLIAETGTSIIVTNEGNGDLTQTLPRVHIVLASIEKVVPTLEDVSQLLRVLARSATAQEMSVYTTFSTGPRRAGDPDGPNEYHVIILDNGRTAMLGGQFREMLRCIRCGACMNHCPVYAAVGGHTYGWVYPGPMGAVLTPNIVGIENSAHLPNASTFCGRCEEVCPVKIPLPKLMRHWREREFERHLSPATVRYGIGAWGFLATRPKLYAVAMSLAIFTLGVAGKIFGRFRWLPLAGAW